MIKGQFTSVWSNGSVTTSCTLNPSTGELSPEVVEETEDLGCLEREFFQTPDGEEYEVCPICHEFITKIAMIPDATGIGIHESPVCSNPECDYNQ
jgi:hypothetical protein